MQKENSEQQGQSYAYLLCNEVHGIKCDSALLPFLGGGVGRKQERGRRKRVSKSAPRILHGNPPASPSPWWSGSHGNPPTSWLSHVYLKSPNSAPDSGPALTMCHGKDGVREDKERKDGKRKGRGERSKWESTEGQKGIKKEASMKPIFTNCL